MEQKIYVSLTSKTPSQIFTKIGHIALQSNKQYLLFLFLTILGSVLGYAQEDKIVPLTMEIEQDTIFAPILTLEELRKDSKKDSTEVDTVKTKPPLLLDVIKYKATDYVRLSQKEQKIYLYNEAEIQYQDTELKAGVIVMDYVKNEVYAGRIKDSLGNYTQLPYFKQGTNEVIPDSIRFNFDTQKAIIWNSRTEQEAGLGDFGSDAMKVYADITKKENDSVYFLKEGKLTTSTDTINPDYYIRVHKAKFVPKKKVIAGFSNLYIMDIPTPIALPFAYFPLSVGRSAGIIMPTFGNDADAGYFLQDIGYYIPFGDYADLYVTGDFYTNGSWGFNTQSIYTKRYKYSGNINFSYENIISSQKGFSDYSLTKNWNLKVSHSQDAKASTNSTFSASVNMGSSKYYQNSLEQINIASTQNNTLSSSVSYSKTFPEYPSVNLSLSATHSQNTNTESIELNLPTLSASMERIYPFAKRDGIKSGLIDNINFQYTLNAANNISTTDDEFLKSGMFDSARTGAQHSIPLTTNFKVAKYLSVSVGGTYQDIWTLQTYEQSYDEEEDDVVTDTISGFDRYNKYNFSASVGTTLYGTFNFGEDKKIQAIRHTMRPSLSYGYAPSFEQFYDEYIDEYGDVVEYSRFENTLYGAPGLSQSSSLSFSLANTLEAKVRDKDSTVTEPKKVSLLSNFNVSTGYNFESDSLNLSPLSISGSTSILDSKMSINFSAGLDPYAIDNNGTRINTFNINNGGSLFRLTRASANVGYSISNETFGKKGEGDDKQKDVDRFDYTAQSGGRTDDLFGKADNFRDIPSDDSKNGDEVENPAYGTKLPWDLKLAYSASYSNAARQNEFSSNSLMFSGNIELSPRWKVGGSSGYDFKGKGFSLTQLRFERDLKSFVLRFNWTPFGTYKRWYFFIGIKSSILSDLKWESRSK
ncbi:putative LPS assembly protein LptD [Maribacter polysaccharolyticus]|uniref:putative LPS assembly protein LptD n=1 Tax=Maribacter polysaccharolyticus TaxID=3020831 RepID=UPI00237F8CEA|nr:putative LPS assembly protein LptD [Maribacter polysaccharolyticus]MDE3743540.1 putative LPS assembly protein LptD [Maribacter polysaccharolyticus]